jgi:hypothetical protein
VNVHAHVLPFDHWQAANLLLAAAVTAGGTGVKLRTVLGRR